MAAFLRQTGRYKTVKSSSYYRFLEQVNCAQCATTLTDYCEDMQHAGGGNHMRRGVEILLSSLRCPVSISHPRAGDRGQNAI